MTVEKNEDWLRKHLSTIGGSNAATAVGQGFGGPARRQELAERMRAAIAGDPIPTVEVNSDMRRGSLMEPLAAEIFSEQTGIEVRPHDQGEFVQREDIEFAHALPDYWTRDVESLPVEIKCPRPQTCSKIALRGLPDYYYLQAIHNLAILRKPMMHFAIFNPVDVEVMHLQVERDTTFEERLFEAEAKFFEQLKSGEPFDYDVDAEDTDTLQEDLPAADSVVQRLQNADAIAAAVHLWRCKEMKSEVDELIEDAKQQLITLAGDEAEIVEVPDGEAVYRIYRREQPGALRFDQKRAEHLIKLILRTSEAYFAGLLGEMTGPFFDALEEARAAMRQEFPLRKRGVPSRPFKIFRIKEHSNAGE
jgi:predicted phage-related endonuclease